MSWSSGEQWLDPSTTSRSGPALVPLEPLSGEQGSIPLAAPEAETSSQVSGRETLEKPDNTSILAPLATLGKPSGPKCLLACNKLLQALPGRILCTHCGWPPRPLPWCRNLSGLKALCPTSRPGLQSSARDAHIRRPSHRWHAAEGTHRVNAKRGLHPRTCSPGGTRPPGIGQSRLTASRSPCPTSSPTLRRRPPRPRQLRLGRPSTCFPPPRHPRR